MDGFEHRLDRRHGRAQVVAGPRDELAARVEQLLEVGGHRVERLGEVLELSRRARGRAGFEVARGQLLGRALEAAYAARDAGPEEQRGDQRGRRAGGRDGEDLHVIVHVEHHEPSENHRREWQPDRQQREPGELQAHGRQPSQRQRERDARGERAGGCDQRELDHGVNL